MQAPDGGLVEINTSTGRSFVHVHLMSEHPLCATGKCATWRRSRGRPRAKVSARFRMQRRREPLAVIRPPAATVRIDDISLIIYPRQRPGPLASSAGHVVDHICAFGR